MPVHGRCASAFLAPPAVPPAMLTCRGSSGRATTASNGAKNLVCLNNASRRPKPDVRFGLPHSRFEGRFVPINEQMTFQAEMEALDSLDEVERSMASKSGEEGKFDDKGDVSFGLRIEMSSGWSKKSMEARSRWKDPEYRKKVIRKREASPMPDKVAPEAKIEAPVRKLPQLHDLLQSDMVSWTPHGGGWVGSNLTESMSTSNFKRGSGTRTTSGRDFDGAGGGRVHKESGRDSEKKNADSPAMQKKIEDLRLLHQDQNAWMALRLSKASSSPARGEYLLPILCVLGLPSCLGCLIRAQPHSSHVAGGACLHPTASMPDGYSASMPFPDAGKDLAYYNYFYYFYCYYCYYYYKMPDGYHPRICEMRRHACRRT